MDKCRGIQLTRVMRVCEQKQQVVILHITKFKVQFEFLVGQTGFCDLKHAQYCHTCEKMPQNSQYVLQNIKIFTLKKINCKLKLMKRNLDKPSQPPPLPLPHMSAIAGAYPLGGERSIREGQL